MSSDEKAGKELEGYRRQIDAWDEELVEALGERMKVVEKIGALKKRADLEAEDKEREREVRDNWKAAANRKGLSWTFVEKILEYVLNHSKNLER